MKKVVFIYLLVAVQAMAQPGYTPTAENLKARQDFQNEKFGMFIHWGVSSMLGSGEWVMNQRNIKVKEYTRLAEGFYPIDFNAKDWVGAAKSAGMKYITLISRHHDGFCNFDSKYTDWKITNTPFKRDVVKEVADECHKQGIKLFLYYSLLDWYRPDYQYETGKTGHGTGRTGKSDWNSYINFMKNQLTELLTNYGDISGIWFDGHWDQLNNDHDKTLQSKVDWHYDEIYSLIHKLQPNALIGNNHHLLPISGEDFQMFEKDLPGGNTTGFGGQKIGVLPLEMCETINNSWGYNITDDKYKSTKELVQTLVKAAGYNANFLLNVGPQPNGEIQPEFIERLKQVGEWTAKFGEAIYGTRGGPITPKDWGVTTQKDGKVYVHVLDYDDADLLLSAYTNKVSKISVLGSGEKLNFKQDKFGTAIELPKNKNEFDTILILE